MPLRLATYILLVAGYFGTVCKPTTLVQLSPDFVRSLNPKWTVEITPGQSSELIIWVVVGTIISLVALASGVALLRAKTWGRLGAMTYCVLAILATLGFGFRGFSQLDSSIDQYISASTQPIDGLAFRRTQMAYLGLSTSAKLVLPLGLLALMLSPRTREQFQ